METANEDFAPADVDAVMTMLTPGDVLRQDIDTSDEVESLRNSLREAIHDDSVRPKMQCLMMDSSFSMVTMQGEDSGIAWETTPSRCNTPWASEAGTAEVSSPLPARPMTPGSQPAGKIIFLMDEEMLSRRRRTKEKVSNQKSRAETELGSSEDVSGRPELVEVSQPNVKAEGEGDQEETSDSPEDKEQRLFSIVSEGSEILNIVVPPKMATVDEEESKEMVDNLSYLEESPLPKANEETQDTELEISTGPSAGTAGQVKLAPGAIVRVTDPPGAPVPRPPPRGTVGNVDYFEAFSLIDAQAPGDPAMTTQGQEEPEQEAATESGGSEKPEESQDTTFTASVDKSDTISFEEITSDLLDEVFYAGTESCPVKSPGDAGDGGATPRLPSKPSGSNLFGSQEEILTPIFLPDGPPKIIDPILLEEPKAMAFLYTDLYEEALGSRKKEEDTESLRSEKSFHSRHSDREARGYLEKYVLIDETPVVEVEQADKEKCPEGDARVLAQDLHDFEDLQTKPEKGEEEITDFFRSSANSSPYEMQPFPPSAEEDDKPTPPKRKAKTEKSVSIVVEKAPEAPVDPLSISTFEFPPEEPDLGGPDDYPADLDEKHADAHRYEGLSKQDPETNKPVPPPRRKAASAPKACLDLTPLTPVDVIAPEDEEVGAKEQREEEKETASPADTTDEGDGDGEGALQASSEVLENVVAMLKPESADSENVKDSDDTTDRDVKAEEEKDVKAEEEKDTKPEEKDTKPEEEGPSSETETASNETELKETDVKSDVKTEINPETQGGSSTAVSDEAAQSKSQCVIL